MSLVLVVTPGIRQPPSLSPRQLAWITVCLHHPQFSAVRHVTVFTFTHIIGTRLKTFSSHLPRLEMVCVSDARRDNSKYSLPVPERESQPADDQYMPINYLVYIWKSYSIRWISIFCCSLIYFGSFFNDMSFRNCGSRKIV